MQPPAQIYSNTLMLVLVWACISWPWWMQASMRLMRINPDGLMRATHRPRYHPQVSVALSALGTVWELLDRELR